MDNAPYERLQEDVSAKSEQERYDFERDVGEVLMNTLSDYARFYAVMGDIQEIQSDETLPAEVLRVLDAQDEPLHFIFREWNQDPQPLRETLRQAAMRAAGKVLAQEKTEKLAYDIDDFMHSFDQHGYDDNIDNRDAAVQELTGQLMRGDTVKIRDFLEYAVSENEMPALGRLLLERLDKLENTGQKQAGLPLKDKPDKETGDCR